MTYILFALLSLFLHCSNAEGSYFQARDKLEQLIQKVERKEQTTSSALLEIDEMDIEFLMKPSVVTDKLDKIVFSGLPVCSGAASGVICFNAEKLADYREKFGSVIWITNSISNDDLCYLKDTDGICAFKEDPSSHAIIVTRIFNVPCLTLVKGASITSQGVQLKTGLLKEGDIITLDGFNGHVYSEKKTIVLPTSPELLNKIMDWTDRYTHLSVHANADTVEEAEEGLKYGAKGIDPRSEHMFFHPDNLKIFRKVILQKELASDALIALKDIQKKDILRLFQTMKSYPVKIRLLDPPLHEFLPKNTVSQELANDLKMEFKDLQTKVFALSEDNPMMGHRGVRLLLTFPEILITQARAIFEAAADPTLDGIDIEPVIIIPMIVSESEVISIKKTLEHIHAEISEKTGKAIRYKLGVMIETPRACLLADRIADHVSYFSFGTNDLTGLTFGFSRGDVFEKFLKYYLDSKLLPNDPFSCLDPALLILMDITVKNARKTSHHVSIGICGEQASEKSGVFACHQLGLDSVSCSPSRVPSVRLFAAQAAILYAEK
jgi:pyruvate,orthophosphate dikinase